MNFIQNIIRTILIVLGFVMGTSMQSCVDEKIVEDTPGQGDSEEVTSDALTFYIDAGSSFATRYSEDNTVEAYEDYINTNASSTSVRVFFFDKDGNFIFKAVSASERIIEPVEVSDERKLYKVTVQIGGYTDDEGKSIAKEIRDKLRDEKFKVAFLINWPNNNRPSWYYKNSILNPDKSALKTLNDLHHVTKRDENYKNYFSYLIANDSVSDHRNWVQERKTTEEYYVEGRTPDDIEIKSNDDADSWLRKNWDPLWDYQFQNNEKNKPVYRLYTNLWQLWNFGGSAYDKTHILSYDNLWDSGAFSDKWISRNANTFNNSDDWFGYKNGFWFTGKTTFENDGLTLIQKQKTENNNAETYLRTTLLNDNYGIIMPQADDIRYDSNNNQYIYYSDTDRVQAYGSLMFTAQNSGHLRIKYSSLDSREAKLNIQRSSNFIEEFSTTSTTPVDLGSLEIKITGNPEPIFIYNPGSNQVVVYAIEFISDIYLYESNREGVKPSKQSIPMFGVQEYDALGTWKNGETVDLKDKTPVSLIRSVAKVEVFLPDKAKHIYMRSMNRKGDCETMDVNTSTSVSWAEDHLDSDCEWFIIKDYTPWISNGNSQQYEQWYKWFYGTWTSWKNWNDVPSGQGTYPRIFNPHIERSDFCEFIYVGEQNGSHKYILYVPDKCIADPNDAGTFDSAPKIAHIEYRYDVEGASNNLDDNNCYRIYFTDYTKNQTLTDITDPNKYDEYERDTNNLKDLWPIMRNHIYRFVVKHNDGQNVPQVINARVNPWGYEGNEEGW